MLRLTNETSVQPDYVNELKIIASILKCIRQWSVRACTPGFTTVDLIFFSSTTRLNVAMLVRTDHSLSETIRVYFASGKF